MPQLGPKNTTFKISYILYIPSMILKCRTILYWDMNTKYCLLYIFIIICLSWLDCSIRSHFWSTSGEIVSGNILCWLDCSIRSHIWSTFGAIVSGNSLCWLDCSIRNPLCIICKEIDVGGI